MLSVKFIRPMINGASCNAVKALAMGQRSVFAYGPASVRHFHNIAEVVEEVKKQR